MAETLRVAVLRVPKVRAAAVSVAASVAVLSLKFFAYVLTGSVAVLSDAAESVVNVVGANVALVSLIVAVRPPDATHQYGHGKAEFVSSATEGVLIFAGGAWILVAALQRWVHPEPLRSLDAGIVVLAVATVANFLTAGYLMRVSHQVISAALEADARHLQVDVLTSAAVLAGIGLVKLTGWLWVDALVGVAVAVHILQIGVGVSRQALEGLMDSSLPEDEQARIRKILDAHREEILSYHALRARRIGSQRFVDLHLVLHRILSVGEAHALSDHLEAHIREELPGTDITIHVAPGGPDCPRCWGGGPDSEDFVRSRGPLCGRHPRVGAILVRCGLAVPREPNEVRNPPNDRDHADQYPPAASADIVESPDGNGQ